MGGWHAYLVRFEQHYEKTSDITPRPGRTVSLGTRAKVQAIINQVFPGIGWYEPQSGDWSSPMGDFNVSTSGPKRTVDSVTFYIRASDEITVGIIELAELLNCQIIEGSTGEFVDYEVPIEEANSWHAYRDQLVAAATQPPEPPRFWKAFRSNPLLMLKALFCNRNARR